MNNIEYICFLNETGYGQAASDLIFSLLATNKFHIKVNCINGRPTLTYLSKEYHDKIQCLINNKLYSNLIQIYHCIPNMQFRFPKGQRSIGFATFETFNPPDNWIRILNNMDAVICPSMFNYKIFAHAGVEKPLFYIPHCFDKNLYNKNVQPTVVRDKFTFLYFASWKRRKGWEVLLNAYFEYFKQSDNVQLLIKTDKINVADSDIEKIKLQHKNKKDLPEILLERRIYNNVELPNFLKSAHCLVMPTLGEGFGLPALQCMALKIPVIVTNFSGCQDYASEETSFLIEPAGFIMEQSMDQISQFANKKWPYLTVSSVGEKMIEVFNKYEYASAKASYAYDFVHEQFAYDVAARSFANMLEIVYHGN
jgi:glycosyltransferase involved in cell wall biosynthesis